jgi:hypothetical protein
MAYTLFPGSKGALEAPGKDLDTLHGRSFRAPPYNIDCKPRGLEYKWVSGLPEIGQSKEEARLLMITRLAPEKLFEPALTNSRE